MSGSRAPRPRGAPDTSPDAAAHVSATRSRWTDLGTVLAVLFLAAIAYGGTLHHAFVYDDLRELRDNALLRDLGNYRPFAQGYAQHPTRYVGYVTFALNRAAGGLDVVGFRLVNLALHVANALLVYVLVLTLFATPRGGRSSLAPAARAIGFTAAALFVAHPLQTEAVTYLVQRLTSLATLLYLATVVQYARWRIRRPRLPAAIGWARYAGVVVTAALAMRTKEIAITLPATLLVLELVLFGRLQRADLLRLLPVCATAILVPIGFVNLHGSVGQVLSDATQVTHVQTPVSRLDYLRTEAAVLLTYLRLLVVPVGQNVDHDFPVRSTVADPQVAAGIALLGALAATAGWLLWRTRSEPGSRRAPLDAAARVAAFGIAWFFVTIAVESSVIPIIDVIFEHRVYLPSVGIFLAIATAAACAVRPVMERGRRRGLMVGGAAVALVLAVSAGLRNRVWQDEITLWGDAVAKSPAKARPHYNLGVALARAGRAQEAIEQFRDDLRIDPDHVEGYTNLGAALLDRGDLAGGVQALHMALQRNPDHPEANYDLGRAYLIADRDLDGAILLLRKALLLRPDFPEALANLAAALNRQHRYGETIAMLEAARATMRDSADAHFNLAVAYAMVGDAVRAVREGSEVQRLSPSQAVTLQRFLVTVSAAPPAATPAP